MHWKIILDYRNVFLFPYPHPILEMMEYSNLVALFYLRFRDPHPRSGGLYKEPSQNKTKELFFQMCNELACLQGLY